MSEEDIPPETFLPAPGGNHDFGFIDDETAKAIGVSPGPICLQQGYPTEKGFGKLHVASHRQRMKQILGLGYPSVEAFVFAVGQCYTIVQDGGGVRLKLVYPKGGYDLSIVVTPIKRGDRDYWNTVTALPYRESRNRVLYRKVRSDGSEPASGVAEKRPRFATLSLPKKE